MKKLLLIFLAVALGILPLVPVFAAYSFYIPVTVTETGGSDKVGIGILLDLSNDNLVSLGYLFPNGLDTEVQVGGLGTGYSVGDSRLGIGISTLSAYQEGILRYYTGYSPIKSSFDIVPGFEGYITVADDPLLELGDNFSIEIEDAYIDTSGGSDRNLVGKEGSYTLFANVTDTLTAKIALDSSILEDVLVDGPSVSQFVIGGSVPAGTNWESVDDPVATPDEDVTYVYRPIDTDAFDRYTLSAWTPAYDVDSITSVSVYFRARFDRVGPLGQNNTTMKAEIFLKLGGVTQTGTDFADLAGAYTDFNGIVARPGGGDWTEADIADLEAGITLREKQVNGGFKDTPRVTQLYVVIEYVASIEVSALDVSSGKHDITTTGIENAPLWSTGDTLHFDGTSTSNINAGAIHDAEAKVWVSFSFNLDSAFSIGVGTDQYLWSKRISSSDSLALRLTNANGRITLRHDSGGDNKINIGSAEASWNANQWYHVIASISSVEGARLIIDNGAAITDADTTAAPNGGNVIIGDLADGFASGIVGEIINVSMGTDDLTIGEEEDLYNGIVPADAVNYWYIDEGQGTTTVDYGTGGNDGAIDSAPTWQTSTYTTGRTGRWTDFSIEVDTERWGMNLKGSSVVDNANDWILMDNSTTDFMPYMGSYRHTVGGTLVAKYEPRDIISGTVLPDEEGDILKLDGTATSNINAGVIHNSAVELWWSLWFRLDADFSAGSGNQYLVGKQVSPANDDSLLVHLDDGTGSLQVNKRVTAATVFVLNSSQTSWTADVWYHMLLSISSTEGARLRIDNGVAVTDTDTSAAPNGGDLVIGDARDGLGQGLVGIISNVSIGTDDLTLVEETNLYGGGYPSDTNNIWYINEGTGTNIVDYGLDGDNGTVDSAPVWATAQDGVFTWGARLADSGSNTTLVDSKLTQIDDFWNGDVVKIKETTDGLAPEGEESDISDFDATSDTLTFGALTVAVDAGDRYEIWNNGQIILWGAFPPGIQIEVGAITAFVDPVSSETGIDDPTVAGTPTTPPSLWGGAAPTNLPLYDLFSSVASQMDWTAAVLYVVSSIIVAVAMGLMVLLMTGSALAAGATVGLGMFVGVSMGILPLWMLLVYVILAGSWTYLAGRV